MALIDEMTVYMKAGKGGNGVVRWLHEKFKEFGGPKGGDGGRGGNVYARGVRDVLVLARYKNSKEFHAENGQAGANNSRHGANGESLYIDLPVGSVITNKKTGDVFRLDQEGQEIMLLKGGNGGFGNEYFKSSTNQQPEEFTPGKPGESAEFFIEVELIADAGLIGLPNAGKSSLLNALTKAHAKVGAYEFTTLEPNLGGLYGFVLADIPGLIEGASEGRGLGHKFLRHVKRTRLLVHCISLEHAENIEDLRKTYNTVRKEIETFDSRLAHEKEIILLTKTDTLDPQALDKKLSEIKKSMKEWKDKKVISVSVYDIDSLKELTDVLTDELGKKGSAKSAHENGAKESYANDFEGDSERNVEDEDSKNEIVISTKKKKVKKKPLVAKVSKSSAKNSSKKSLMGAKKVQKNVAKKVTKTVKKNAKKSTKK